MRWAFKNLGCALGGLMCLFAAFAVTNSVDRWAEALNSNTVKVAGMDTCKIQMAELFGKRVP